jgi:hypothetical protein
MTIAWHRIFGMALTQYFAGTDWKVDVEVDLSLQQQRLDLVILRRAGPAAPVVWPDGFGTPAEYNLLTFKALQDPLDAFALKELAAHGVNYRKLVSPDLDHLLPEGPFRLVAVSMRFPRGLADRVVLQPQGPGAYDVLWGSDTIRVLVLREMPDAEQNLVWNLFSSDRERITAAFQRLGPRLQSWSSILNHLLRYYGLEGMAMPYTMEDFEREVEENFLRKLTPEKLLARLSPEQLLAHLSPEQRLEGLSAEQVLSRLSREEIEKYLRQHKPSQDEPQPPEQLLSRLSLAQRLQGLSVEQVLSRLPREEIERYLRQHKPSQDEPQQKPPETQP